MVSMPDCIASSSEESPRKLRPRMSRGTLRGSASDDPMALCPGVFRHRTCQAGERKASLVDRTALAVSASSVWRPSDAAVQRRMGAWRASPERHSFYCQSKTLGRDSSTWRKAV